MRAPLSSSSIRKKKKKQRKTFLIKKTVAAVVYCQIIEDQEKMNESAALHFSLQLIQKLSEESLKETQKTKKLLRLNVIVCTWCKCCVP